MTLRRMKTNKKHETVLDNLLNREKKEAKRIETKRYRREKRISLHFLVF